VRHLILAGKTDGSDFGAIRPFDSIVADYSACEKSQDKG
jgi:hypothetical protein